MINPTIPIGAPVDFMQSMPSYATSESRAATRINFATGGFSGTNLNVKNILIIGAIVLAGLFIYKRG